MSIPVENQIIDLLIEKQEYLRERSKAFFSDHLRSERVGDDLEAAKFKGWYDSDCASTHELDALINQGLRLVHNASKAV